MAELKIKLKTNTDKDSSDLTKSDDIEVDKKPASMQSKSKIKLNLKAMSVIKEESSGEKLDDGEISSHQEKESPADHKKVEPEENIDKIPPTDRAPQQETKPKINLSNIKSDVGATANTNTDQEEEQEDSIIQEDTTTHQKIFGNYESHFEKKSQNFLDKLRNFKTSPKTRVGLIFFLISATVITIGSLMYFAPEKHSLKIYKGNILEIYNTNFRKKSPSTINSSGNNPTTNIQKNISPPKEIPTSEPTSIPEQKKQKVKDFLLENYGK